MVLNNVQVIITCVNYCDFLKYTYPHNIRFFLKQNYHIITDKSDSETIEFCNLYNQPFRLFDYFKDSSINKAGAIHMMQTELHEKFPNDWILLLDADILLPGKFEVYFNERCTNKEAMYSFKRKDYEEKEDFEKKENLKDFNGVTFMGYMQLYFDKTKFYESYSKDCCTSDTIFRDKFYSTLTFLDPDDYVIHLGYERLNYKGRISKRWE